MQNFLKHADRRAMGDLKTLKVDQIIKKTRDGKQEEVLVKATGRAIEKALQVALFFQGQDDCAVRLRTGNVATVDDIVPKEIDASSMGYGNSAEEAEDLNLPETRLRKVPMLEIAISLK